MVTSNCHRVTSRYLPPERHILEGLIVFTVATAIIHFFLPGNHDRNIQSAKTARLRPPPLLRKWTLLCFLLQLVYKAFGYPNKVLAMLLPCNVLWFMTMIISYAEVSPNVMNNIIQLLMTYIGLPILALLQPDTSDCVLFGEKIFFFVHHSLLIYYPLYYIWSGYDIGNWKEHLKWISLGSAFFACFYICFVTPICVISGLNLNYLLHPSLDLVNGGISGQWFRWLSLRNLILLFSTMRTMLAFIGNLPIGMKGRQS